jgi:stage II sporulation protein D
MPSVRSQRIFAHALATIVAVTALVGSAAATPARADDAVTPTDKLVIVTGAGWGHGRGMSQYGAYRAAKKGLSYSKILAFYYTGTTLGSLSAGNTMRVWISADTDAGLHFRPVAGLQVYDTAGHKVTLPTGSRYTKWRISRKGNSRVLSYRNAAGTYVTYASTLTATRNWWVKNTKTGTIKLAMPSGSTRTYSGRMSLRFSGSKAITVNYVSMETYLRSVVPAEMPASWSIEAVKAQAVAARTYAAKERASQASGSVYDICDTSSCQVYKENSYRATASDAAIKATANKVVLYKGAVALTQFTSSNGGWTAAGDYAYLSAKKDPYDPVSTWTKTITAATLQKAYPKIGTFTSIQVSARTGVGPYNGSGRASAIILTGSAGQVMIKGTTFKSKFGLKETLFALSANQVNTTSTK